jgi:hypothetical protein
MKKFKRVLSSLLAAALTVSAVAVANVSSVFAEDAIKLSYTKPTSYSDKYTDITQVSDDEAKYEYNFEAYATALNVTSDTSFSISNGNIDSTNYFYGLDGSGLQIPKKNNTKIKLSSDKSWISFSLPTGVTADLTIAGSIANSDGSTSYAKVLKGATCSSGTAASGTAVTASDISSSSAKYASLAGGQTIAIARASSSFLITKITINVKKAEISDGIVKYNSPTNGTVKLLNEEKENVETDTEVAGGTKLTLSAVPDDNYYAKVTLNNESVTLNSNNSYEFSVNGDVTIVVEFKLKYNRSDITSTVSWSYDADEDSKILEYGEEADSEYYFSLTTGATLETGKRITVNKGDLENKSVVFKTGDLTGKTAKLIVNCASGGDDGRSLVLNNTKIATPSKNTYADSNEAELQSNTEYYLASDTSGGIYIRSITITVTDNTPTATSKFNYDKYVVNGGDLYVIGYIADADVTTVDKVGFGLSKSEETVTDAEDVSSTTVYRAIQIGDNTYSKDGCYVMGYRIEDGNNYSNVWAAAFSTADGTSTFEATPRDIKAQ